VLCIKKERYKHSACFVLFTGEILFAYLSMTIEITAPVTKEKVQEAINQLSKETAKKSLRKHFGRLKRNIDGLEYQKQVRNEWV
jgi:hypothetical protein